LALFVCAWALGSLLALVLPCAAAHAAATQVLAGTQADAADADEGEDEEDDDEEDEGLRQRLTEREDKRRPLEPFSIDLAGRPLTLGGEYEIELAYLRRRVVGGPAETHDRLLLEQGLELEAFYSLGEPLSLFAQLRLAMEEDLLPDTLDGVSSQYVERGEMWLYSEDIAGTHLSFDIGRLHFEDDRRWWWDDELDAVRVGYETSRFEAVIAVARELAPERSDEGRVDPEQERLLRVIGEVSFDWAAEHGVEVFVLHQEDYSHREREGRVLSQAREDDFDARLTWVGARALGIVDLRGAGLLGYWLDGAYVGGREHFAEYEDISNHQSEVESVVTRNVRGWGVDAGLGWLLPFACEPRVFAGFAFGSGDDTPESGSALAFRQTGIQANEGGFGGVERFAQYGTVLDPELSNLGIVTAGVGLALLRSSSLDLVYHYYRLADPATELLDARLETELTGTDRDLGHGLDLVLALEEWERFEFDFVAAAFRAGKAFGSERGSWSYGGGVAVRYAF
jgi:hypothetical protein